MTAISTALQSAPIDRLKLTKNALPQILKQWLGELDDIVDPTANHRAYKAALTEIWDPEYSDTCIPWLGESPSSITAIDSKGHSIAVHLRDLNAVLQKYPPVTTVDGRPLINFERYIKFTDRVKEVLHHKPPVLERYRQQGQLAYLEHQLRNLQPGPSTDDELMARSRELEVGEARDFRLRTHELHSLGFATSKKKH